MSSKLLELLKEHPDAIIRVAVTDETYAGEYNTELCEIRSAYVEYVYDYQGSYLPEDVVYDLIIEDESLTEGEADKRFAECPKEKQIVIFLEY